jgi:hypothetical protein
MYISSSQCIHHGLINYRYRPVLYIQASQWRALLKGEPVSPSSAYKYITGAFRQTTGHIVGAMRLLAATYGQQELNKLGFSLYAEFRPVVDGWGKKAEIRCENILKLKRAEPIIIEQPMVNLIKEDGAALDKADYENFFTETGI